MGRKSRRYFKRRPKRTTKRRRVKRGGEYLGRGSFGKFYANPRLPCNDETTTQVASFNEGSKVFAYDEDAEKEWDEYQTNILNMLRPELLNEMRRYFIFPIRKCNINKAAANSMPYTSNEWKRSQKGIFDDDIFTDTGINLPSSPDAYNQMVIFEKGGKSLGQSLKDANTQKDIHLLLRRLVNAFKGIQLLQNNDLIHGDIKLDNMVESGTESSRIIDNTTIRSVDTDNMMSFFTAWGYFVWPATNIFTIYFSNNGSQAATQVREYMTNNFRQNYSPSTNMSNVQITPEYLNLMRRIDYGFNSNNENWMKQAIFPMSDYNIPLQNNDRPLKTMVFMINDIKNTLQKQKTIQYPINMNSFNAVARSFTDVTEFKHDILKRIDVYSLGSILAGIFTKLVNVLNLTGNKIPDRTMELYYNLYKIIEQCCSMKNRVANINNVVAEFETIMNELQPATPEIVAPIPSVLPRPAGVKTSAAPAPPIPFPAILPRPPGVKAAAPVPISSVLPGMSLLGTTASKPITTSFTLGKSSSPLTMDGTPKRITDTFSRPASSPLTMDGTPRRITDGDSMFAMSP